MNVRLLVIIRKKGKINREDGVWCQPAALLLQTRILDTSAFSDGYLRVHRAAGRRDIKLSVLVVTTADTMITYYGIIRWSGIIFMLIPWQYHIMYTSTAHHTHFA